MVNIQDIINILPNHIRNMINEIQHKDKLQEIRIKVNKPLILGIGSKEIITSYIATLNDLTTIIQRMSNYSIYAVEEELKQGYITIKGGHRVGICGNCVVEGNRVKTIRNISSLNIRICREVKGCSNSIIKNIVKDNRVQNTIIISPPKCGKTTLIRDISRNLSNGNAEVNLTGKKVCIIDERSEIAACYNGVPQMDVGIRTDVLDNCPKNEGIMMAIRSMSPDVIVCDEIGTYADIESIIMALNSGVSLITTIHGYDIEDLYKRNVFKDILSNYVFNYAVVLSSKNGVGTIECIKKI
ncbi:MAG: stage III sporulation protein AA [Bacillota bacterium]|nr:stage III sporulation protein AA [Bacillota bacterium]